jgi:glycine/D-amino acid oxidase-like deaminating enzyme
VIVLEKKSVGGGATEYTTAFLTYVIDTDLTTLVDLYGKKQATDIWNSHKEAIDSIEQTVNDEHIDCEFSRCNAYLYATSKRQYERLQEEEKTARKLGFNLTLKRDPMLGFPNEGYLEVENQAKFHPLKFLNKIAELAYKRSVEIYEKTEVVELAGKSAIRIKTKQGYIVTARDIIITTYDPFNKPKKVFAKKGMYTSYVLEVHFPKNTLREGIYWDQHIPYYYFRIDKRADYDRMILGGADHREEIPIKEERNFNDLETYLKNLFPHTLFRIAKKWSGPILEPSDGIALIGEYKKHHLLAAGFSGNGMTYSAIAAHIFRDTITGKSSKWIDLYDPKRPRKPSRYFKKGLDYTKEFFGGAVKNVLKH